MRLNFLLLLPFGMLAGCGVEISQTFPSDGSSSHYYLAPIEFHLTKPDTTAVASIEGVAGASSLNDRADIVVFTPDAPLSPSTGYSATLDYCTASPSIGFTTSELGLALSEDSTILDVMYNLDLKNGRVVVPEGVGAVLQQYLDFQILMSPVAMSETGITVWGALADTEDPDLQDFCNPTIPFPEGDFSQAPYFQIGPQETTISVADYDVTIENLLISGTFAPDGTWFGGGEFGGEIDSRPLVPLLLSDVEDPYDGIDNDGDGEIDEDAGAICDLLTGFGVSCKICNSDGEQYCLEIKAVDLTAMAADNDNGLDEIALEDCHAECADTWETDEDGNVIVDEDGNATNTNEVCELEYSE